MSQTLPLMSRWFSFLSLPYRLLNLIAFLFYLIRLPSGADPELSLNQIYLGEVCKNSKISPQTRSGPVLRGGSIKILLASSVRFFLYSCQVCATVFLKDTKRHVSVSFLMYIDQYPSFPILHVYMTDHTAPTVYTVRTMDFKYILCFQAAIARSTISRNQFFCK